MIFINNDETYTNNTVVNLSIENNSAEEMYITNSKDCSGGGIWEPYSTSKVWTLNKTNTQATVYAKFRENSLSSVESTCSSDTIVHDDIAPTLALVQAAPQYTSSNMVQILVKAADNLSGVKNLICKDAKDQSIPDCREGFSHQRT